MNRWLIIGLVSLWSAAALAQPLTVAGKSYEKSITIDGRTLTRLGAGIREKWMFDVYVLAAYSASGSCDPAAIVDTEEAKYLRIDMLRDVSAEKMATTIGNSFAEHMPKNAPHDLLEQKWTFESYFKEECSKGTTLEFIYFPGVGTAIKQNGKELGAPLPRRAFMNVLWDIYFGAETCCGGLKESILKSCK